jgi:hypothetical protein
MTIHLMPACAAAFALASLAATPIMAATAPLTLRIPHGQSVQDALRKADISARLDRLRAQAPGRFMAPNSFGQVTPPAITAGAVLSGTITVGKPTPMPSLQISYTAGKPGFAGASFTFTSPNGAESFTASYADLSYSRGATVTFNSPLTAQYYLQPGKWVMSSAYITDYAYNYTEYTQAQLAQIFATPYLTVINKGPVDITPPVITAGQILTPTVSLSSPDPTFEATLTGTDDVSGVAAAFVIIEAPGGSFGQVNYVPVAIPSLSGTFNAYSGLYAGQPTGTWSITGYELCDIAGNCFSDSNAADVQSLFGTSSFTVTN